MHRTLPESIYTNYVYAYPHKTAYRPIQPSIPLRELWCDEDRRSLFLYIHVPFCEFRCGFCNLFTRALPPPYLPDQYLRQLQSEAQIVLSELGESTFSRFAIGGGTPTFLNESQLTQLFQIAERFSIDPKVVPTGIECSPATMTPTKLELLLDFGVERISIGIQSLAENTCKSLGRPQNLKQTHQSLELLARSRLQRLNVDLIYGSSGDTTETLLKSIEEVLIYQPTEIFLYPLYVRPLTGLARTTDTEESSGSWDRQRVELYRAARAKLIEQGYQQKSMRMFARPDENDVVAPEYCCQNDSMVGLGCGARSYTRAIHYSHEYAVGRQAVNAILDSYIRRPADWFRDAHYGFVLDDQEQQRRYLLVSLLQAEGMEVARFHNRFDCDPQESFPELELLVDSGLLRATPDHLQLTEAGLERSDQIGPYLFSDLVAERMEDYQCT